LSERGCFAHRVFHFPGHPMTNLGLTLVAFGDESCHVARRRLLRQARDSGYFDHIYVWGEKDLDWSFRKRHKKELVPGSRGFGYWVWKPQVILQALKKLQDGQVLLYVDVGCHIVPGREEGMARYVDMARGSKTGVLCGEYWRPESEWTKGDIFDFFEVRDNPAITETGQRIGTAIFLVKRDSSSELMRRWLQVCEEHPDLILDSPSISPNLPGFRENRHDQSLLSVLSKLAGVDTFPAGEIEQWRRELSPADASSYPIEARRDRYPGKRRLLARVKKRFRSLFAQ
jgi:hypothetical protein